MQERWDEEYRAANPNIRALSSSDPSISAIRFIEYLRESEVPVEGEILDVGCGVGRNANWFATLGFNVVGMDFSEYALAIAKERAHELDVDVAYQHVQIGKGRLPIPDGCVDFIFDSMMSHLLPEAVLKRYLNEATRVLKESGKYILYVPDRSRDKGSLQLLKEYPGPERNTYINPDMRMVERTFTPEDLAQFYYPLKVEYSEVLHRPTRYKDEMLDKYYLWAVLTR